MWWTRKAIQSFFYFLRYCHSFHTPQICQFVLKIELRLTGLGVSLGYRVKHSNIVTCGKLEFNLVGFLLYWSSGDPDFCSSLAWQKLTWSRQHSYCAWSTERQCSIWHRPSNLELGNVCGCKVCSCGESTPETFSHLLWFATLIWIVRNKQHEVSGGARRFSGHANRDQCNVKFYEAKYVQLHFWGSGLQKLWNYLSRWVCPSKLLYLSFLKMLCLSCTISQTVHTLNEEKLLWTEIEILFYGRNFSLYALDKHWIIQIIFVNATLLPLLSTTPCKVSLVEPCGHSTHSHISPIVFRPRHIQES